MGVQDVSTVLMVLGVCLEMNEKEREVTTSLMIEGFNDCVEEAGSTVTGGQTILSPWPIIGGVGITGTKEGEFVMPIHAKPGDQILLTKPLATQVAVNTYQWLRAGMPQWEKIKDLTNSDEIERAFQTAEISMATLNRLPASLFKKYNVAACTDVTGFGILGHATYLAQAQRRPVTFELQSLPLIQNMLKLDKIARDFKLMAGSAAETSGGLLIIVPQEHSQNMLDELIKLTGWGWHIGEVKEAENRSQNKAVIVEGARVIDV